jgi:hypothetical protein
MRGYGHEADGITRVPEEAKYLAAAAEQLLSGEVTLAATAEWMTENAGPTVFGRPWSSTTLRRRLLNPAIAGLRRNAEDELVDGPAEPIIDRETFEKLDELFSGNRKSGGGSGIQRVHLLAGGAAECVLCDGLLVSRSTANGGRGYVCETPGCGKVRISADPLDTYVSERALARLARPSSLKRLEEVRDRVAAEAAQGEETIKELKEHKEQLARDYGARLLNKTQFLAAKEAAEEQRRTAMAAVRRGRFLDELPELTLEAIVEWWNERAGAEQKRTLLQLVVRTVRVGPATVRGSRKFDEDRFSIAYW